MVPVKALIYSRVSTDAQERDGTSLDTQERESVDYVQSRGWRVVECIRDTASGSTLDRPGIQRVRQLLRQGALDVVVAYAVDRLSRNQNHIGVLFDEVDQAGATLDFVTEKFEDTAIGRFILAARAFVGEVEREKIAERTMRGKEARARSGKIPQGTGNGIYGYRYNRKTGHRAVLEEQASVVKRVFEQFCTGAGCSKIAKDLNEQGMPAFGGGLWHPLTVRRMLQNETYTGRTTYRRTRVLRPRGHGNGRVHRQVVVRPENEWVDVPGATPPIISVETFSRARAILDDPARRLRGRPTKRYRLRGHVRCSACGTPMVGQALARGRYRYYRCRRSYAGFSEGKCDSRYVRTELLEKVVLEEVAKLLANPGRILEEARRLNQGDADLGQLEALDNELNGVEEQQRRLAKLYVSGSIPEGVLAAEGEQLSRRRGVLESQKRSLEAEPRSSIDLDHLARNLPQAAARLRKWVLNANDEDMELILRALDLVVRASPDEVHIEGAVPVLDSNSEDLVTIVQTSGCSRADAKSPDRSMVWVTDAEIRPVVDRNAAIPVK